MRVLVCGGRYFDDRALVWATLCLIWPKHIIQGGAGGADKLAKQWAMFYRCAWSEYAPEWEVYGKSAGPIRNQKMLVDGAPDMIVAFAGGRGTTDMVTRARASGVIVKVVS